MKRILVFLITAGAALIMTNQTKAQSYYTTTYTTYSYNNYNDWDLPYHVRNVVTNYYGGCGIVNARSYYINGHLAYNLFLNTGNTYVEIEVDRFGYVTRRVHYNAFPMHHVWVNNYSVYYKPKHHHGHHHGHHNGHAFQAGAHHHHSYGSHAATNLYIEPSHKKGHKTSSNSYTTTKRPEKMYGNTNASRTNNAQIRERSANRSSQSNREISSRQSANTQNNRSATSYAYNSASRR